MALTVMKLVGNIELLEGLGIPCHGVAMNFWGQTELLLSSGANGGESIVAMNVKSLTVQDLVDIKRELEGE